nr:hypothetical protein CFP56_04578 [Quercus suber]
MKDESEQGPRCRGRLPRPAAAILYGRAPVRPIVTDPSNLIHWGLESFIGSWARLHALFHTHICQSLQRVGEDMACLSYIACSTAHRVTEMRDRETLTEQPKVGSAAGVVANFVHVLPEPAQRVERGSAQLPFFLRANEVYSHAKATD